MSTKPLAKALPFKTDRRTATLAVEWRHCEFCGCKTNAKERICCQRGRQADRHTWDRPADPV
jgi:hypothetical protein